MSFSRSPNCALCTTQPSVLSCEGCQRRFCYACLEKHRNDLSLELDDLFNRRNELMEIINNRLPNDSSSASPYYDQINRWQNDMHANIDRIAAEARNTVKKVVTETRGNIQTELDQISQELQRHQKTNDYVEDDLNRVKQQLIKLNLTVQQLNNQIRVDTSGSGRINWDALIFVASNDIRPMNTIPAMAPPSPNLYNSLSRNSPHTMSLSRQQHRSYTSPSPPTNPYRVNALNATVSMGSAPTTYRCVGCKTVNTVQGNGRNFCSVCHFPAQL